MAQTARLCEAEGVHPALALLLAMAAATLILGALKALASLRDVPEAYEDDEGFWRLADNETARPARVRIAVRDRVHEER